MSNFKKLVEARAAKTGESWSTAAAWVRAQAQPEPTARLDRSDRAIEVLVFDPSGRYFHGIVTFVPPGLPNGAMDPREGLIMGGVPTLKAGPYVLVEPTGRARRVRAERSAGGGAFMAVFTEPDAFVSLQVIFASLEIGAHGMPTVYERYKVMPKREQPPAGIYAMGVLPLTGGASVKGFRAFGWLAWRELLVALDAAHPGLQRRLTIEPVGRSDAASERLIDDDAERRKPGPHHEEDCPLRHGAAGECECLGPIEDYSSEEAESYD